MPEPKYLWRAKVAGIAAPIYLVAQNFQSAGAQAINHPQVAPEHLTHLMRIDPWDDAQNMTVVHWPAPPPEPPPYTGTTP